MNLNPEKTSEQDARRMHTVWWVLTLATVGLIFDGYDLVVYGAVVSTFLRDATQIGTVTPPIAGALGSYALFGVALGALLAGSVGDIVGRRKVMLVAALASGATVTLLDQPFTALDLGSIAIIQEFLHEAAEHPRRAWIVADYTTPSDMPLASVLNLDASP